MSNQCIILSPVDLVADIQFPDGNREILSFLWNYRIACTPRYLWYNSR